MAVADDLQAVSVDEALLDVTSAVANLRAQRPPLDHADALTHDYAKDLAEMLRAQILGATKCELSIGIGSNVLLARFATKRAKPASAFHLHDADAEAFLADLPVDLIWGVGWSMRRKAEEKLGIRTIGELATKSKAALVVVFGPKTGEMLWGAARGLSDQKIESSKKRKSVSAEINVRFCFRGGAFSAPVRVYLTAISLVFALGMTKRQRILCDNWVRKSLNGSQL
jgi:DNA repair protein REV1